MVKKTADTDVATDDRQPVKAQYVLEERHVRALRAESLRRAAEKPRGRPDASEVLREILDAWLARGGGKR